MLVLFLSTILMSHLCLASCGYSGSGDSGYSGYQPPRGGGSSGGWGWMSKPKESINRFYSFDPNRKESSRWGSYGSSDRYGSGGSYGSSYGMGSSGYGMGSSGYGMGSSGYGMGSSGYGMGSSGYGMGSSGYGSSYPVSSQWGGSSTWSSSGMGSYGGGYNDAGRGSHQRQPTFPPPRPMGNDIGWGSNLRPPPPMNSHSWGSSNSRYPQSPHRYPDYHGKPTKEYQGGSPDVGQSVLTLLDPNYYSATPWPEAYANMMMKSSLGITDTGRYSPGGSSTHGGRYQRSESIGQQAPFPDSGQYNLRFR